MPRENGGRHDNSGNLLQGLLAQLLPDLSPGFPLAVTESYTALDLVSQEPIFCHPVLVAQ
jgi:hypothetical protein